MGAVLLLRRRWLAVALGVCLAAFALGLSTSRPPAPRGLDTPAHEFSAARAEALIERLIAGLGPHPVGTPANAVVRDRIVAELEALGYDVEVQADLGCLAEWSLCGHVENLIARLPDVGDGPAVMITAHYDSVGAGPGVSDDMVGVAAVLEAARALRSEPAPRNPVVLLISDGEEAGLLGAAAFVQHPLASEVAAVVNLEARGTSGPSMLFETSDGNAGLIRAFLAEAKRPVTNSLLYELYRLLPNDTDFSVYKEAGMAGVNFAYVDDVVHYHTSYDDLAHLDRRSLQHQGDNAFAALRALANADLATLDRSDLVYADVAPGVVMRWPGSLAPWLAGGSLLVWLGLAAFLTRRGLASWGGVLLAFLLLLVALAAAGAAGFAVSTALVWLSGLPQPWYSDPAPSRAVLWAAAFLMLLLCLWPVARRAGAWSLTVGVWLVWSGLALASALLLTGASVFFQLPLTVATLLFAAVALARRSRSGTALAWASLAAVAATAYLWLPFAVAVEGGLGFELAPAVAVIVALGASSLGGLLAQRERGPEARLAPVRVALASLLVVVILVCGGLAVTAEPYTAARPQRLNIAHLQTSEVGSVWLLLPSYGVQHEARLLPGSLLAAGGFGSERVTAPHWLSTAALAAPAPPAKELPSIEVVEVSSGPGLVSTARVRLDVPDGADLLELNYRAPAGLESVRISGSHYQLAPADPNVIGRTLHCHGRQCSGMEVEFEFATSGGLRLSLAAIDYGLPPEAAALLAARPATAVPSHRGDVSVRLTRLSIAP